MPHIRPIYFIYIIYIYARRYPHPPALLPCKRGRVALCPADALRGGGTPSGAAVCPQGRGYALRGGGTPSGARVYHQGRRYALRGAGVPSGAAVRPQAGAGCIRGAGVPSGARRCLADALPMPCRCPADALKRGGGLQNRVAWQPLPPDHHTRGFLRMELYSAKTPCKSGFFTPCNP